jgi:myo-inositol-1(or 4)-monophosphatase
MMSRVNNLEDEAAFFHRIAQSVIELVQQSSKAMAVVESKGVGDYSTQVDINVENLIVSELRKRFPDDHVLAEEGYSNTTIPAGRIWLIDPICGTNNLGKGINNFCTNIALVDAGEVVASCVVDHSQNTYMWSVGEGNVFVNDKIPSVPAPELGYKIDIDFGSVKNADNNVRQKHNACLLKLINETGYDLVSLNTSLGFAYTAIGKTDGFINVFNHPWDIAAASFLIQQSGGVLTGIDGSPWTITTVGAIGGRTPEIHKELLDLFLHS